MRIQAAAIVILQVATFVTAHDLRAQLTITTPETSNPIRQVSSIAEQASHGAEQPSQGIVAARRQASSGPQIRVTIHYLMVDDATRDEIYESFEPGEIKRASFVSRNGTQPSDSTPTTSISASHRFASITRVTSCVLSPSQQETVVGLADASVLSDVKRAPSVVLLQGNEAVLTDMVQRPFVVDIEGEGNAIEPKVHVLDEGTRVRLMAVSSDSDDELTFDLSCGIEVSRVVDVKTDKVFGARSEPMTVHVPLHQVTIANISSRLGAEQSLLIDPHVSKAKIVEQPSGVPILSKIPYVARSFKNVSVETTTQHMMVLLHPSVEASKTP